MKEDDGDDDDDSFYVAGVDDEDAHASKSPGCAHLPKYRRTASTRSARRVLLYCVIEDLCIET